MSQNKKIIIVGNSDNNLKHKVGDQIDAFDKVVRFNDCVVSGYEEYVGSRTDYLWLTTRYVNHIKKHPNACILVYPKYSNYIPHKYRARVISIPYMGEKSVTDHYWSSGLSVIKFFLSNNWDVTIHGIADGGNSHYWDANFKVLKKHKLDIERERIKKWDLVKRLVDF